MKERFVSEEIKLVPYYRNDENSLPWYLDLDICKQVDNRDLPYDVPLLHAMYDYLCLNGDCFYIEYKGKLIGDVSLLKNGDIAIVVSKNFQNKHIGRKCILEMIKLAKEKGLGSVKANVYSFNEQSKHAFLSVGFHQIDEEWYEYRIK